MNNEIPPGELGKEIHYRRCGHYLYQCATWSSGWFAILPWGPLAGTTGSVPIRFGREDDSRWSRPLRKTRKLLAEVESRIGASVEQWKRDNPKYRGFPKRNGAPDYLRAR